MENERLQKWAPVAWKHESPIAHLPVPFAAFLGEAIDAGTFAIHYWEPKTDELTGMSRPGLSSAVTTGRLGPAIGEEILELVDAFQSAVTSHRLALEAPKAAPVDQAQALIASVRDTLGWYFLDVSNERGSAQLDRLDQVHQSAHSHDAIAAALYDYAALAEQHAAQIDGVVGFDVADIDKARKVADALRARSASPLEPADSPEAGRLLELRNRVATLLYERMQLVRTAARVVFKDHPDLIRKVTSDYERRRRAARRQRAEVEELEAADTSPKAAEPPSQEDPSEAA